MKLIQILIQRFISENPTLFKYLSWSAGVVAAICQLLFWADSYFVFAWMTEAWRGLLNDILFTALGVFTTSQLTTDSKMLQNKTESVLHK